MEVEKVNEVDSFLEYLCAMIRAYLKRKKASKVWNAMSDLERNLGVCEHGYQGKRLEEIAEIYGVSYREVRRYSGLCLLAALNIEE